MGFSFLLCSWLLRQQTNKHSFALEDRYMKQIQILGTGCAKCKTLAENAKKAVEEAGIEADIEKVEDIKEIMKFNVLMTPGLVIDGEVKAAGRVLSPDDIKKLLVS